MSNSETNNLIEGRFQIYQANTKEDFDLFVGTFLNTPFDNETVVTIYCSFDNTFRYYRAREESDGKYYLKENGE